MSEGPDAIVKYRLEQADESLESAEILLRNSKCRPAVNRAYYAMFYALLGLLAQGGTLVSKHAAIISAFDREYVKKGVFASELSRWLHEAFDLRQRVDYRELFEVTADRAEATLENAREFVAAVKGFLEARGSYQT